MTAAISVVDRARGISPRAFDRSDSGVTDPAIAARLAELRVRAKGRDALGILTLALEEFPKQIAVVSSFGSESVVLLHLMAQADPATPVLFLNTGKLFGETLRYRDRLQDELGLTDVRSIGPNPDDRA
ncbi:MAG: phosphoadenosine phosphosulfate reductase family protein, partial [Proteobacteria bacterium]|nr:phosphoadenosine phosphosulfate reductase family protein [Pseudomonadota bacterium]